MAVLRFFFFSSDAYVKSMLAVCERLEKANLTFLSDRRRHVCLKLFNQITKDPAHKLSSLFPTRSSITHDLRNIRDFQAHVIKTDRFLKTFVPSCIKEFS